MHKFIMVSSFFVNALLLLLCIPLALQHFSAPAKNQHSDIAVASRKIAILTPLTHPSLQKVETGFKEKLLNQGNFDYRINVFNANGNKQLLYAQAEEIMNNDYDLVFTIATQPSLLMKELATKKQKKTPLVFGAADPDRHELVQSREQPGGTMTGVYDDKCYQEHVEMVLMLKPTIKNVLLVYNPTQGSGLDMQQKEYEKIFAKHGITLHRIETFNVNEVYAKSAQKIAGMDMVLVLKDNTVVPAIDALIKLCSLHNVTLMASDLDSGDKGAALSFGVSEEQFGIRGAELALKILEQGENPATLPCVNAGNFKLKINSKSCAQQGLILSDKQFKFYGAVIVI